MFIFFTVLIFSKVGVFFSCVRFWRMSCFMRSFNLGIRFSWSDSNVRTVIICVLCSFAIFDVIRIFIWTSYSFDISMIFVDYSRSFTLTRFFVVICSIVIWSTFVMSVNVIIVLCAFVRCIIVVLCTFVMCGRWVIVVLCAFVMCWRWIIIVRCSFVMCLRNFSISCTLAIRRAACSFIVSRWIRFSLIMWSWIIGIAFIMIRWSSGVRWYLEMAAYRTSCKINMTDYNEEKKIYIVKLLYKKIDWTK